MFSARLVRLPSADTFTIRPMLTFPVLSRCRTTIGLLNVEGFGHYWKTVGEICKDHVFGGYIRVNICLHIAVTLSALRLSVSPSVFLLDEVEVAWLAGRLWSLATKRLPSVDNPQSSSSSSSLSFNAKTSKAISVNGIYFFNYWKKLFVNCWDVRQQNMSDSQQTRLK